MTATPTDLGARTEQLFRLLADDDTAAVRSFMTPGTARALTPARLDGVWKQVVATSGPLRGLRDTTATTRDGRNALARLLGSLSTGTVVQTTLVHHAGEWTGRAAFDGQGRVTGLLIVEPGSTDLPF